MEERRIDIDTRQAVDETDKIAEQQGLKKVRDMNGKIKYISPCREAVLSENDN